MIIAVESTDAIAKAEAEIASLRRVIHQFGNIKSGDLGYVKAAAALEIHDSIRRYGRLTGEGETK